MDELLSEKFRRQCVIWCSPTQNMAPSTHVFSFLSCSLPRGGDTGTIELRVCAINHHSNAVTSSWLGKEQDI